MKNVRIISNNCITIKFFLLTVQIVNKFDQIAIVVHINKIYY